MDNNESSWPLCVHSDCLISYQNARFLTDPGGSPLRTATGGCRTWKSWRTELWTKEVAARLTRSEKQHLNGEEKSMYIYSQQQITKSPKKS